MTEAQSQISHHYFVQVKFKYLSDIKYVVSFRLIQKEVRGTLEFLNYIFESFGVPFDDRSMQFRRGDDIIYYFCGNCMAWTSHSHNMCSLKKI